MTLRSTASLIRSLIRSKGSQLEQRHATAGTPASFLAEEREKHADTSCQTRVTGDGRLLG